MSDILKKAPGDGYDIPPVREPSTAPRATARRATEREPSPEPREERMPRTSPKPITLHDIVLYDATGKPFRDYEAITFAGEALRDTKGRYILKTQDNWVSYYSSRKEKLPSLSLLYAIIEKLHTEKHPAAAGLLEEFKGSYMVTSTRIDYAHDTVTHDYGTAPTEFRCPFPEGGHWVKDMQIKKDWRTAFQVLLQPKDVDQAMEILGSFAGVNSQIYTASDRKSNPLRAAFVLAGRDRLLLGCYGDLTSVSGSRPVAL